MTVIFNGQGFSTLPRELATEAYHKLMAAMISAKGQGK